MSALEKLLAREGRFRGGNRLHDPHSGGPEDSEATARLEPLLGGRFLRFDYTWSYQGRPQQGSLLIGYETDSDTATVQWIDSWHNGEKVMACSGRVEADGGLDVKGGYAAPPGPDWGWRTRLRPTAEGLEMSMFNIDPGGQEAPAVEARYTRVE